jgi:hypothetical protein
MAVFKVTDQYDSLNQRVSNGARKTVFHESFCGGLHVLEQLFIGAPTSVAVYFVLKEQASFKFLTVVIDQAVGDVWRSPDLINRPESLRVRQRPRRWVIKSIYAKFSISGEEEALGSAHRPGSAIRSNDIGFGGRGRDSGEEDYRVIIDKEDPLCPHARAEQQPLSTIPPLICTNAMPWELRGLEESSRSKV